MINTIAFPGLGIGPFNVREYFTVFGMKIHWYGVIIAVGILLAFLFVSREAKKKEISQDTILDIVIFGLPAAIICARIYYVVFEWDQYKDNFLSVFKIWEGGIAIYGGIIGACLSTVIYCHVKRFHSLKFSIWAHLAC